MRLKLGSRKAPMRLKLNEVKRKRKKLIEIQK